MERFELLRLPDDPLLHVLSFVNYRDLINCCFTCQRLRELTQQDALWRTQCKAVWFEDKCTEGKTWKETFIHFYEDLGKYVDIYGSILKAWKQIEVYMEKNCPTIHKSIQTGLSEDELSAMENGMQLKLPRDLRCAYRIHNGQKPGHEPGLMGSMQSISSSYRTEVLLPLHMATDNIQTSSDLQGCLPLTFCFHSHVSQMIVLSEEKGYTRNQIFYPIPDNSHPGEMALMPCDSFIVANNFQEWFCRYAQQLEDDAYIRMGNVHKQVFLFSRDPECMASTGSIHVKVATAFNPEHSTLHPPLFFHTYHITMWMDDDADESEWCELESRYWVITDEEGHEETVEGPGVVGEYPTMKAGETFSWTSYTTFPTTYGNMRGHFTMKNIQTG
ncbi:hypothetical protein CAPTEDRAFT_144235 [Capitella teleta]|uniref:F-box domain-containing protein n=1 Tax=Capitella teleta TaxID=283909 RepID=R7V0D3_CAPTE|nr:hypothetical protein CAPTEDRAFT_144235 [Capitella teleta]|eukprot:ELU11977.1 hypothetical protein CAPTEDRAFT_144235 [Capitella teleta]